MQPTQRGPIPVAHRPRNAAPPPPGTFRTKPCRHFEQGRCTWGASCRFLHSAAPSSVPPAPVPLKQVPLQMPVQAAAIPIVPADGGLNRVHPPPLQPIAAGVAAVPITPAAGAPATPVLTVRVGGGQHHKSPPGMGESVHTQCAAVAIDTPMPPTHPNTPASVVVAGATITTPLGTPGAVGMHGRYTHNPYQSSPLAPNKTSPGASGSALPFVAFADAVPLAALPKPMQQQQVVQQPSWKPTTVLVH